MTSETLLPRNWAVGNFTDALEIIRGISFPTDAKAFALASGLVGCLRTKNVQATVEWDDLWYVPNQYVRNERQFVEPNDILISTANSLELVGKVAQISDVKTKATIGTFICLLRPDNNLNPKFVFHQLASESFQRKIRAIASTTTNISNVSGQKLASLSLLFAPRAEQDIIVAEIEKQFTRLEVAVAALRRVRANLKRYRASVLKAACEGRLVPKQGEWSETTIRESVKIIDYRGRTPPFAESGIPHLRSSNIKRGRVLWTGLAFVTEDTFAKYMTRGLPEPGDILFTTEAPLGEVAPAPTDQNFSVAQRIMILRPKIKELDSAFLMYQIMSPRFQAVLNGRGTGTTVTGVSSRNFRPARILLPPLNQQHRIVGEIERLFSIIEGIETQVDASVKRAERLRQAILKRAFEGKLVPQDPKDEPASILLERIRADRARRDETQRANRKSKPKFGRKKEVATI